MVLLYGARSTRRQEAVCSVRVETTVYFNAQFINMNCIIGAIKIIINLVEFFPHVIVTGQNRGL